MAAWHALLGFAAGGFTAFVLILVIADGSTDGDGVGLTVIAGVALTAGGLVSGAILGAISFVLLRGEFWGPNWRLISTPGLVGTLVTVFTSFIGWPTSEVVGVWAAYRMVSRRLAREEVLRSNA